MMNSIEINYRLYIKVILALLISGIFAITFLDKELYQLIATHFNPILSESHDNLKTHSEIYEFLTSEKLIMGISFIFILIALYFGQSLKDLKNRSLFIGYQIVIFTLVVFVKSALKIFFARCSPEFCFYPEDNWAIYFFGFSWLRFKSGFLSFPSGHCLILSYGLIWGLSIVQANKFKYLIISVFLLVFLCLVSFSYHFLGDCLIGTCIGLSFGLLGIAVWNHLIKINLRSGW